MDYRQYIGRDVVVKAYKRIGVIEGVLEAVFGHYPENTVLIIQGITCDAVLARNIVSFDLGCQQELFSQKSGAIVTPLELATGSK